MSKLRNNNDYVSVKVRPSPCSGIVGVGGRGLDGVSLQQTAPGSGGFALISRLAWKSSSR